MVRVLLLGRKAVAARCLKYLCGLEDVEVVGVICDNHLEVSPTRDAATDLGIPLLDYRRVEDMLGNSEITFDLGISVLYWRKVTGQLLEHPRLGFINFHPAPLPELKGFGGYNLAILENHQEYGTTAHYMDSEIDTGRIIEVSKFPLETDRETAKSLEAKSMVVLYEHFKRVVLCAIKSEQALDTYENVGGRYYTRKDIEEMKYIQPGDNVERKIRAFWFPPYDGAKSQINGTAYTLVSGDILESLADPESSSLFTSRTKQL